MRKAGEGTLRLSFMGPSEGLGKAVVAECG